MPLSDDEFDAMQEPQISTMSKAELRKTHKPIMEKRRRARINHCLNEIKNLILEAMNKDPARHTKLEKADILEMAVNYLQNVQKQQLAIAIATDPSVIRKFKNGFNDCVSEIDRFMSKSSNSTDNTTKDRVATHLQKCINGLEQVAQFSSVPSMGNIPLASSGNIFTRNQSLDSHSSSGDQNNNPSIQIPPGIQLIPSRLPTGELALLVPNSSNLPYFPTSSSSSISHRPSAFVTVTPHNLEPPKPLSPPLSPVELPSSASPKGFRPVHSKKPTYLGEDHQVPHISSTIGNISRLAIPDTSEVKSMKFPIHRPLEKDRKCSEPTSVIKKLSEPLCVITNQGERYRQAQQKEDSVYLEENQTSRGVKREYSEILSFASHESRPSKVFKTSHYAGAPSTCVRSSPVHLAAAEELRGSDYSSSTLFQALPARASQANERRNVEHLVPSRESLRNVQHVDGGNQEDNDQRVEGEGNDMWRPW